MGFPSSQGKSCSIEEIELRQRLVDLEKTYLSLQKENEILKELYDRAPLGYQSLDKNGHVLEVNTAWLQTLGYNKAEVIGKDITLFLHPEWRDRFEAHFSSLSAAGEIKSIECAMLKKDGNSVFVLFDSKIEKDPENNFLRTYCVFQDITRQKQTEQALFRSEEKWQNIAISTPQICISLNPQGRINFANNHFLKLVGWIREEVIGQDWFDMFLPDQSREQVREIFLTVMGHRATLSYSNYENTIVTRTRELRNIAWSNVLSRDSDGNVIDITCMGVDLTAHRLAEEALQASKVFLVSLLETIPIPVCYKDIFGRYLGCNKAFEDFFQQSKEQLIGKSVFDLNPLEIARTIHAKDTELFEKKGTQVYESKILDGSGMPRDVIFHKASLTDSSGKISGMIGAVLDITERTRAEEERAKLQSQLIQAQKMESVGQLAGGVAHDFNNMLGVILGHTEMALELVSPKHPLYSNLTEIGRAAKRSADITRQLLAFARKQTIEPKVLDLNESIETMLKMLRRLIGEDIELSWTPKSSLWKVLADPSQIDQMLTNICLNARSAIEGVGKITVQTGQDTFTEKDCASHPDCAPGDYVWISVRDTGCGMDEHTLNHIFEPFFTTKNIGEGTGLGLAMVFGAVKQNKGFITVASEPEHGSTFTIYLPKYFQTGTGDGTASNDRGSSLKGGNETILLVEDEPIVLHMIRTMIQRLGYSVLTAGSPGEALRLVNEFQGEIHLLVTDVVMPEMNGMDLAVRLITLRQGLKCLFISGYTSNTISNRGTISPKLHFIKKPFLQQELASKIREVLDESDIASVPLDSPKPSNATT